MILPQTKQWEDVLELLREGPLTPLKSWGEIGVYRISDAVFKLRKRGYVIETHLCHFTTSRGRKVRFAEYRLIAEPQDAENAVNDYANAMVKRDQLHRNDGGPEHDMATDGGRIE